MPALRTRWLLLLGLLLPSGLRTDDADPVIPSVGRPADLPFSEASGDFRVWADAQPTTLEAQKPLTLTLHVEARADFRRPPHASISASCRHSRIGSPSRRSTTPASTTWPTRLGIRLPASSEERGSHRRARHPFCLLQSRDSVSAKGLSGRLHRPDPADGEGASGLRRSGAGTGGAFLLRLPTLPRRWRGGNGRRPARGPSGCCCGRRRCYAWPGISAGGDCIRTRSTSRTGGAAWLPAARLQALRGAGRLPPIQQAARAAAVVAEYLRSRFNAPAEEPTPTEAAACLERAGCSAALAEQSAAFFRACDAARFAPLTPTPLPQGARGDNETPRPLGERGRGEGRAAPGLPADAARFILAVEAETWSGSRS